MRLTLAIGCLFLNGCALAGVYGPEAQQRAQAALIELGNRVDQGIGAFARGYARGAASYSPSYSNWEAAKTNSWHTGTIIGPDGTSFYSLDESGSGHIITPRGTIFINGD